MGDKSLHLTPLHFPGCYFVVRVTFAMDSTMAVCYLSPEWWSKGTETADLKNSGRYAVSASAPPPVFLRDGRVERSHATCFFGLSIGRLEVTLYYDLNFPQI
jgi:hypothetical protein